MGRTRVLQLKHALLPGHAAALRRVLDPHACALLQQIYNDGRWQHIGRDERQLMAGEASERARSMHVG